MRNAGLEEAQVGIKIAGRNINNLRYLFRLIYLNYNLRWQHPYGRKQRGAKEPLDESEREGGKKRVKKLA